MSGHRSGDRGRGEHDVVVRFARFREQIARSAQMGSLRDDPLQPLVTATGEAAELHLQLAQETVRSLHDGIQLMGEQVTASLDKVRTAIQAEHDVVAGKLALIADTAESKDRHTSARVMAEISLASRQALARMTTTFRAKTIIACSGAAVMLAIIAIAGGYVVGLDDGIARQMQAASSIEAEARTSGPEALGLWARLMHDNDVRSAMAACQKAIVPIAGRRSCALPVWLDPPPVPVRS